MSNLKELSLPGQFGIFQKDIDQAFLKYEKNDISNRIWAHDHTVWKEDPSDITNRLGWLHSIENMTGAVDEINKFTASVRASGYTQAVLLGMGGSSLAPEVFRLIFGVKKGFLDLSVLDSTDPKGIINMEKDLDLTKTLFIVSTKSGGTTETRSLMTYFYNRVYRLSDRTTPGDHFVAITDPGSSLESVGKDLAFRKIFLNDPEIGGRYSALSYFGLVPAALIGVNIGRILEKGKSKAVKGERTAIALGISMGKMAHLGKDKLTLVISEPLTPIGAWVEQLIAESLGKDGNGILPVTDESLSAPDTYGTDRLFVQIRLNGDTTLDSTVKALRKTGHPVIYLEVSDLYDLGGEFFRWEMATAIAGSILKINPFDQPDVESAKVLAREMVNAFRKKGQLPKQTPAFIAEDIRVYFNTQARDLKNVLKNLFSFVSLGDKHGKGRSYVAIQAYLTPELKIDAALQALRTKIQNRYQIAVTVGYGPRFLHSTGQLHKGDAGNGLFIQLTAEAEADLPIPDNPGKDASSMTFNILKTAQAMGDRQALIDAGRQVIRFHLPIKIVPAIQRLTEYIPPSFKEQNP